MLKDADPAYFAGIYIVCGYTDLRYGIDSLLTAIIERKYHLNLFVSNTLFLFCGKSTFKIRVSCGKSMASCFFTNVWNPDISHGHGHLMISNPCLQNSFTGSCRALQSNLLFMMSHHKVPVKLCFYLCNTENFFPVFRTLQGLQSSAQHSLFLFSSFFFLLGNPISQLFIYGHFYLFLFLLNCSFFPDSGIMVPVRRHGS